MDYRKPHVFDPVHNGADECECGLTKDAGLHPAEEETTTTNHNKDSVPTEPCGVCKFHWDMIVMPGELHNPNCPHFNDAERGCACQGCGQRYKVDVVIPDNLWDRIKPKDKANGAGLLCGRCIFARIETLGQFDAFTLSRISPASAAPVVDNEQSDRVCVHCGRKDTNPTYCGKQRGLQKCVFSAAATAAPPQTSSDAWRRWFDRLGDKASAEMVNATADLVTDERLAALVDAKVLPAAAPVEQSDESEYVVIDGKRRRVIPCPDGRPDCEVLHTEPVNDEGAR